MRRQGSISACHFFDISPSRSDQAQARNGEVSCHGSSMVARKYPFGDGFCNGDTIGVTGAAGDEWNLGGRAKSSFFYPHLEKWIFIGPPNFGSDYPNMV